MNSTLQKNRLGSLLPAGLPEFDNLFNHFFRAEEVAMWRAPASIWEAENVFHIEVNAPGVKKEDVELTFDKGTLQISLEHKHPTGNGPTGTTSVATARFRAASRCRTPWIRTRSRPSSPTVCCT